MEKKNYIEKEYKSIDIMKFIAAIMVVCIHTLPFQSINPIVDNIFVGIFCRIAVPFFFISSSFLLFMKFDEDKYQNRKVIIKYIKNIIKTYILWSIVYLILDNILGRKINLIEIIHKLFTTGFALQMWYFPAIIIAISIVYLWYEKLDLKGSILISSILYIIGLLGTTYYSLLDNFLMIKQIIDCIISIFGTTRNGIFFGVPYVSLGYIIVCKYKNYDNNSSKEIKKNLLLLIISFFIMSFEGLIISIYVPNLNGRDMFISLPFVSYFLYLLILSVNKYFKGDYKIFRKLSIKIFTTHVAILYFISSTNSLIRFLLTISISIGISIFIVLLDKK